MDDIIISMDTLQNIFMFARKDVPTPMYCSFCQDVKLDEDESTKYRYISADEHLIGAPHVYCSETCARRGHDYHRGFKAGMRWIQNDIKMILSINDCS